jgi:uncharacterized protein (DUF4415 family)
LTNRPQRHHPAIPAEARSAAAQQSTPIGNGAEDSKITQQVNFRADRELVRKVKARLALEGRSMQDLLTEYLRDWLTADAGRRDS